MRHLWLIGMMGSGKTTIGSQISEMTGYPFTDTDDRVVFESGRSVAEVFESDGEDLFRAVEEAAVRTVAAEPTAIVATGGGVVLSDASVDLMRATGTVVYLAAEPTILAGRIGRDPGRPLLAGRDNLDALTEILHVRESMYRRAAHCTIPIHTLDSDQVARKVIAVWNES